MEIYHYTTYEYYQSILNDDYIKTSYKEKKWKIKPAGVWLSLNPICENTCLRRFLDVNTLQEKQMNMYEQSEILGLVRFVIPFEKKELCSWSAYKYKTNISIEHYMGLEMNGTMVGSKWSDWYISFQDIPLRKVLRIEIFLNDKWIELTDDLELPEFDKVIPIYRNRDGNYNEYQIQQQLEKL